MIQAQGQRPKKLSPGLGQALALMLTLVLVVAAYSNTFQSPPVLDDFHTFVKNPTVLVDHWDLNAIKGLSTTYFGIARWVPMTTFALDYYLGGGAFAQFHLTNLTIHLLATLVVFFLVRQCLLAAGRGLDSELGLAPAIWIAALWALNPVQTNAVTYMVQRMASLQALFFTLSVACYLAGRRRWGGVGANRRKSLFWFAAAAIAALGAFFSKENSAMLPVMLLVTEIWFFTPDGVSRIWRWLRGRSWPWRVLIGFALLLLAVKLGFYVLQLVQGYGARHFGPWQRLLTEARVVVWYLGLLLLPLPMRLSVEHDVAVSSSLFTPPTTVLSILLILILLSAIVAGRKRRPLITYGGAWFFINLAIESTLVPLELVFEHRLYLPSIGFVMAAVLLGAEGVVRVRHQLDDGEWLKLFWATVGIACACLSLLTFYRNEDWRDPVTFHQDAVAKAPKLARPRANYASALMQAGRLEDARAEAAKVFALGRPGLEDYVVAADTIVGSYMREDNWQEAARRGEELLRDRPSDSDATTLPQLELRVAESLRQIGDYHGAYQHALKSIRVMGMMGQGNDFLTPYVISELRQILAAARTEGLDLNGDGASEPGEWSEALWLAQAFIAAEAFPQARRLLAAAIERSPDDALARSTLESLTTAAEKNTRQSSRWDFSAKYLRKPYTPFRFCMAVAYAVRKSQPSPGLLALGEAFASMALGLDASHPDAHLLMAWYHREAGRVSAAIEEARQAVALEPDYAKAWMGLGLFLVDGDQKAEAVEAFERVLELYPGYRKRRIVVNLLAHLQGTAAPVDVDLEGDEAGPEKPEHRRLVDSVSG